MNCTTTKTLSGHAGTVLAIDISSNGLLSSVAEDGRCILWSSEGEILTNTLVNNADDGSGCSTKSAVTASDDCPLNSVKFVPNDPNKLFISSGNKVFGFDVRKPLSPFSKFEYNSEEINQISINEKGEYLATCDDDGEIKIIDLRQDRLFKTLSRHHSNICSSVQFRHQRPWQIISAGLDCNVIHWDFSTGKPRQVFNVNKYLQSKKAPNELLINPPFAHSISMADDGRTFASGLGNGEIGLFHFKGKTFECSKTFKAHDSEVSQVYYFKTKSSKSLLVSGGNDANINLWKGDGEEHGLIQQIVHGSKINWISCSSLLKDLIFVADQSSNVNVYEIH